MIFYGASGKERVLERLSRRLGGEMREISERVDGIIRDVRARGDEALFEYSLKLDGTDYSKYPIRVSAQEIEKAYDECTKEQLEAIRLAVKNVSAFHKMQVEKGYEIKQSGKTLLQIILPLKRVGIYAPGGTASYPSSVIMNAVPAKIAGVESICLATPAHGGSINPLILVAAKEAGVDEIYRMGGAQAIAAFAYGTKSVKKVDKITGPGNAYVALAKKQVFGDVGIDSIAGPTEVLIIADETANARYIASDMLGQAEHDVLAAAICLTDSIELAQKIEDELKKQLLELKRKDIAGKSIEDYGAVLVLSDTAECAELANEIAPEHIELSVKDPWELLKSIRNAGAAFIGEYSPEPLGDYIAGPNHVLPTSSTARFASPLGVYDFVRRMNAVCYDKEALRGVAENISVLAHSEHLDAHARAVEVRFEEEG